MNDENAPMVSFEEALERVLGSVRRLEEETVALERALGRVLRRDAVSDMDMPPFDKSAMDGYACRSADLGMPLKVVETIAAGRIPAKRIGEGECSKIMTGGVVPSGADRDVMVEDIKLENGIMTVTARDERDNICRKGEDLRAGDLILCAGTILTPAEIAVLAGAGYASVAVSRRPTLGIAATGDELVEPSETPKGAEIRDSNSLQLYSQSIRAGFDPVLLGIPQDTPDAIGAVLDRDDPGIDVFLLTGGVSMGEYDHVPAVLEDRGFELLLRRVAMKPGKPTVFGSRDGQWVFGLPGNPVSTFLVFELFVKPFCYKLMGARYSPPRVHAELSAAIRTRGTKRRTHVPVYLDADGRAVPVDYHGSAHIHAYALAGGFVSIPAGTGEIAAGETVQVTLTR